MSSTVTTVSPIETQQSLVSRRRKRIVSILAYTFLTVAGIMFTFPLYWLASSSLKTWMELRSYKPQLLPAIPQWHNYVEVFTTHPFARWLLNSFLIIAIAVPGGILSAVTVSYGFARFRFKGNNFWFMVMLGTMMLPYQVTLIPQYLLYHKLGWVNTYIPLTLPSWLGGGAFAIFLLRQFIMSIPRDLDEAAMIDGAGPLRILWTVLIPLMRPPLITLGILMFLGHWNNFMGPFIYLRKYELFTAAVGLQFFRTVVAAGGAAEKPREHLLMAGSTVMTAPALILFMLAQRYFVRSVIMSGLKM